jgi:hypothetical protein
MRSERTIWLALLFMMSVIVSAQTLPSVPNTISFQGRITDIEFTIPDGDYEMTFLIYDSAAGNNLLWQETQPGVAVTNGIFQTALGAGGSPVEFGVFNGRDAWLEVRIFGETLTPRRRIVSAPFALRAEGEVPPGGIILSQTDGDAGILARGYTQEVNTIGAFYLYKKDAYNPSSPRVPTRIAYQGRVAPSDGGAVGSSANLAFTLYDADTAGNILWGETQNSVPLSNELYSVDLGAVNPIYPTHLAKKDLWLAVAVNGQTLSPRDKLASAAYAIKVESPVPTGGIVLSATNPNADLTAKNFSLFPGATVKGRYPFTKDAFSSIDPSVPLLINYQGRLTDPSGALLAADTVDMRLAIYDDPSAGTLLYSETIGNVALQQGLFDVLLGSGDSLTPNTFPGPDAFLEVIVTKGLVADTLSPRKRLTSVPFALQAEGTMPPSALILGATSGDTLILASGFQATGDTIKTYYLYAKTEVDTTPPDLTIISPILFSGWSVSAVPSIISYSDNLSGVDVSSFQAYLNGSTITGGLTLSGLTATGAISPSVGANMLLVVVADLQGNMQQATAEFYAEAVGSPSPPIINIVSPANGSTIATSTPFIRIEIYDPESKIKNYSIRVAGIDRTSFFLFDGLTVSWQIPGELALVNGGNTVFAQAQNTLSSSASSLSTFGVNLTGPTPVISSLVPDFGFAGDTLIINGSNFSGTPADNYVYFFNQVPATVLQASPTQLVVKAPTGAATGGVVVRVAGIASNSMNFTLGLKYGFVANYNNPDFNSAGAMISVIGFDGNTPGTILRTKYFPALSHPYDVKVTPDGRLLYATDYGLHKLYIFNTQLMYSDTIHALVKEIQLEANSGPKFIEFTPDGLDVFVGSTAGIIYDIRNQRIADQTLWDGVNVFKLAASPLYQELYLAGSRGTAVKGGMIALNLDRSRGDLFDPDFNCPTSSNYNHPTGITVRPNQSEVYVANNRSNGTQDTNSFSRFHAAVPFSIISTFGATVTPTSDFHDISNPYDLLFDPCGQLLYADFSYPLIGGTWPFNPTYNLGVQKWPANNTNFHAGTKTEYTGITNDYPKGMAFSPGGKWLFMTNFGKGNSSRSRLKIFNHAKVKQAIDNDPANNNYNLTYVAGDATEALDSATVVNIYPGMVKTAAGFDGPLNVAFQPFPVVEIFPHIIHLAPGGVKDHENEVHARIQPLYGSSVMVGVASGATLQKMILPGSTISYHSQWLAPSRDVFTTSSSPNGLKLAYKKTGIGKLLATSMGYPSNVAFVTVPPQNNIQMMVGEPIVSYPDNSITQLAFAAVLKNRLRLPKLVDHPSTPAINRKSYGFPNPDQITPESISEELIARNLEHSINCDTFSPACGGTTDGEYHFQWSATLQKLKSQTSSDPYLAKYLEMYDRAVRYSGMAMFDLLRTGMKQDALPDPTVARRTVGSSWQEDGCFSFYSPTAVQWNVASGDTVSILEALQSGTTVFPYSGDFEHRKICVGDIPHKIYPMLAEFCVGDNNNKKATYIQVVVPRGIAQTYGRPDFIFFRLRDANEPSVRYGYTVEAP